MAGLRLLSSRLTGRATDGDGKQNGRVSSATAIGKLGLTIKEAAVKLQDSLNGDPGVQQNTCIAEGFPPGKMKCQLMACICNLADIQGIRSKQRTPAIKIIWQLELVHKVHICLQEHAGLL